MSAKVLYVTYRKPDEPHFSFAFTESSQVEQYNECAYIKQPKNMLSQSSDFVEAGECVKWQSVTKVEINFAHRLKCKCHMVISYKEHNCMFISHLYKYWSRTDLHVSVSRRQLFGALHFMYQFNVVLMMEMGTYVTLPKKANRQMFGFLWKYIIKKKHTSLLAFALVPKYFYSKM